MNEEAIELLNEIQVKNESINTLVNEIDDIVIQVITILENEEEPGEGIGFSVIGSRTVPIENAVVKLELDFTNFDFNSFELDGSDLAVLIEGEEVPIYIHEYDSNGLTAIIYVNCPLIPVYPDTLDGLIVNKETPNHSFGETFHKINIIPNRTKCIMHFDEQTGVNVIDELGQHNGVLVGNPDRVEEIWNWNYDGIKLAGGAIQLDGINQYVSIPGLLDAYPPSITIGIVVKNNTGHNFNQFEKRTVFFKRYTNTYFIDLFIFGGRLYFGDSAGNVPTDSVQSWNIDDSHAIIVVITPTRLQIFRSNPSTKQIDTLVNFGDYWYHHCPPPTPWASRRYENYPPSNPSPFILGAALDINNNPINCFPGIIDEFFIEDRAWTKDEIEARMVMMTSYIPSNERDYWTKLPQWNQYQFWMTNVAGEFGLYFRESTQRLHASFTGGGPHKQGTAYSDDYGQSWIINPNNPVVGGGAGGVASFASHGCIHWDDPSKGGDDYERIYFSQDGANLFRAKSTATRSSTNDFLSFTDGTHSVLSISQFNNCIAFFNSSVCKGPNNEYYLTVDGISLGAFQTFIAKSSSPDGPFVPVNQDFIPLPRSGGGAAYITYDESTGIFHLYVQEQHLPTETNHYISTTAQNNSWVEIEQNPVLILDQGDGTSSEPTSLYADQGGSDPALPIECRMPDGSYICLGMEVWVNNLHDKGRPNGLRFNGRISELNQKDQRVIYG